MEIYTLRPPARKRRDILWWAIKGEKAVIHGEQTPFRRKVAAGPFWPRFLGLKLGDAGRTRVASKNRPNNLGKHSWKFFFLPWKLGQLWVAVTWPCRHSAPFCNAYSETFGHEDSLCTTFYIPYLFKNLSKSRLSDLFFGLFCWWFLRSGARII